MSNSAQIALTPWALLVLLAACSSSPDEEPDAGASTDAAAPHGATTPAPDPGPVLKRSTGARPAEQGVRLELEAIGRWVAGGATYVEVGMPEDLATLVARGVGEARLVVRGERHALAVPAGEGLVPDRPLMTVRFVDAEPPPEAFEVVWHQAATLAGEPGRSQVLAVKGAPKAPTDELVRERFYDAAGRWFDARGNLSFRRREPFYAFAGARMLLRSREARGDRALGTRRTRRTDMNDLMRFYTGMASVDEALQYDRGLRLPPGTDPARRFELAEVPGVVLRGHPWERLIEEQPGDPVVEPLASWAPADMAWVHFHDLRTLVKLGDDIDRLVRPALRVFEERAGSSHLVRRYERQLAIERTGLAEKLGHVAAKGVALLASDPFLREGTDLTLVFHVNNAAALKSALGVYEARTRERRPDLKEASYTLGEHTVRRLHTDDGEVNQHRLEIDDVLMVSNSRAALEKILAVRAGEATPLAKSPDYLYFRDVRPYDPEGEDGYLFLSDAFVAHVVSPRIEILQARRMHAQADLFAVNYAALLYGWLEGRPPRSTDEMIERGLLARGELKHEHAGPIRFDPRTGASSAWGRPAALRPLIEAEVGKVTAREKGAYARFRETYQSYWRAFIDPIGVHIDHRDDGLRLDARMMPLIERSDYNELEELVGEQRIVPPKEAEGLRLSVAVSPKSELRETVDSLSRSTIGRRDVGLSWLGTWAMVGLADRSGAWDAALAYGEVPGVEGRTAYADLDQRRRVLDRLPIYVGAHVRDRLAFAGAMAGLKGFVQGVAPDVVEWKESGRYRGVAIVDVREKLSADPAGAGPGSGSDSSSGGGVTLHYALAKDAFLASTDLGTLHTQIDAVLDGRIPRVQPEGEAPEEAAQAVLTLSPASADGWLVKTLAGLLERGTLNAYRSARLAFGALAHGLGARYLKADEAERAEQALDWLGYAPASGHGGRFSIGESGLVEHSIYGSEVEPRWPPVPVEDAPISEVLRSLATLRMQVSFEGEGATRGLHTTVSWKRR